MITHPGKIPPSFLEGMRKVGAGKKGSKSCTSELVQKVLQDLNEETVPQISKVAFFASLFMKTPSAEETPLVEYFGKEEFYSPQKFLKTLVPDLNSVEAQFGLKLLSGEILTRSEAKQLGERLFSKELNPLFAALCASCIRMRYAESEEYAGLWDALEVTLKIKDKQQKRKMPLVQMAEPFDGAERSYFLSPLIANSLRKKGFGVLSLVGTSSGPKYGLNLKDVALGLDAPFIQKSEDSASCYQSPVGGFIDQESLSPLVHQWVNIRRQTLKRPFLATLEKYPNPFHADCFLFSAFHFNFTEKMIEVAEEIGLPATIVFFRSVEGSLGLSLGRAAQIFISAKDSSGKYVRKTLEVHPEALSFSKVPDPRDQKIELEENVKRVQDFLSFGKSGDSYFDQRFLFTEKVLEKSLETITEIQRS